MNSVCDRSLHLLQVENTEYSFSERTKLTLLAFGPGLTMQVSRAPVPSWAVLESSTSCTRKSVISDTFRGRGLHTCLLKQGAAAHGSMFPPCCWHPVAEVFYYDLIGLPIYHQWQPPCSLALNRSLRGPVSFDLMKVKTCVKFCGFSKLKFHINLIPHQRWSEREIIILI